MHIGSGLNTVSSMYRQQKGNNMKAPASAEKTFYTAETPKVYQIFTTDNMLWTGGNGTGLSYCLKYADDSTDENPVVLAKGVDENGKEFEQRIYINDVNPSRIPCSWAVRPCGNQRTSRLLSFLPPISVPSPENASPAAAKAPVPLSCLCKCGFLLQTIQMHSF